MSSSPSPDSDDDQEVYFEDQHRSILKTQPIHLWLVDQFAKNTLENPPNQSISPDSDDDQEVYFEDQHRSILKNQPIHLWLVDQFAKNTLENPPNQSISPDSDDDQEVYFEKQHQSILKNQPIDLWLVDQFTKNTLENPPKKSIIDQCAQSLGSALAEVSRNALTSDKQSSSMERPQKPSAFTIKKVMSPLRPRKSPGSLIKKRFPAPHLRKIQNQKEGSATGMPQKLTGNSRIVGSSREKQIDILKQRPWWKWNLSKEKEYRALMPPPRQQSSVNKKVQVPEKYVLIREKVNRKLDSLEENEKRMSFKRRRFKPPESIKKGKSKLKLVKGKWGQWVFSWDNKKGEENEFLFSSSESESEDDFVTLKFLSAYNSNGGNLAPRFASAVVNSINGVLGENGKITVSQYGKKVAELHKKFLDLVQQNGGEIFSEADFSTDCDYEIAKMCKFVWGGSQESGKFGCVVDPKSNVGQGSDKVKLIGEGISLGGAGMNVDNGIGADPGMDVGHHNGAGPGMDVDHRIGADLGMDVGHRNGASADQMKDDKMDIDRESVGSRNARNGSKPQSKKTGGLEQCKRWACPVKVYSRRSKPAKLPN